MRKIFSYVTLCLLILGACTEKMIEPSDEAIAEPQASRKCAAAEVLEKQLAADPKLRTTMEGIEEHTRRAIESGRINAQGKIEIPVIVNVIYRTASENISEAQIQSQINVLNQDFNATNSDVSLIPSTFASLVADVDIQFVLEGINRKSSTKTSWSVNDAMKKSSQGGINPTDPTTKLNIWVVNKIVDGGNTVLGYAQFPGGSASTDGVVIGYKYFGTTGTAVAPFNKGRTTTHEVGHWLNLYHIWGDRSCGNDRVSDTPTHNEPNFGCPSFPHASACSGRPTELTMNYMDYTDDPCMYMFTKGQKDRMLAVFSSGGPRASFAR